MPSLTVSVLAECKHKHILYVVYMLAGSTHRDV